MKNSQSDSQISQVLAKINTCEIWKITLRNHIFTYTVFFINGTDQITKSVNIKVNMNIRD